MRSRALCGNLPDMNLSHISAMVADEKLYESRSPAIRSAENPLIYRLLSNLKLNLTAKIRTRLDERIFTVRFTVKTFCLRAIDADRWRKVKY
jgi:hypothetical protein